MFEDEIRNLKLLSRIEFGQYDSCWIWTGAVGRNGYGYWFQRIKGMAKTKGELAHRLVYHLFVEPIPESMTLDHLCYEKLCVNPDHLELVTRAENTRRGSHRRKPKVLTHCKRDHVFTAENTIVGSDGRRRCKRCQAAARARWAGRNRDQINAYQRAWRARQGTSIPRSD